MKVKDISVQIVKNIGNYESVRLQATAEITEVDNVETSFLQVKGLLEKSFKTFTQQEKTTVEKNILKTGTSEFLRVCKALEGKKTSFEEVQNHFILDKDVIKYFTENKLL